jgi:hypothetical protein
MTGPEGRNDWNKNLPRVLLVALLCGLVLRISDVNLFEGLYRLLGIEKMPWQQ